MFSVISDIGSSYGPSRHDPDLVIISGVVATIAAFISYNLIEHSRLQLGNNRILWLVFSAMMLGSGIWSMHFIGMLAFYSTATVTFNPIWTVVSFVIVVVGVLISNITMVYFKKSLIRKILAGFFLGTAIIEMHYVGMLGYEVKANIQQDFNSIQLSALYAISGSIVSMLILSVSTNLLFKIAYAITVGLTISITHYTAMSGYYVTTFVTYQTTQQDWTFVNWILSFTLFIMSIGLFLLIWCRANLRPYKELTKDINIRLWHQ